MPAAERRAAVEKIFRSIQGNFRALSPGSPNFKYKPVFLNFMTACCEIDPDSPKSIPPGYGIVDIAALKAPSNEGLRKLVVDALTDEYGKVAGDEKAPKDKAENEFQISHFGFEIEYDVVHQRNSQKLSDLKKQRARLIRRVQYDYDYESIVLPDGRHVAPDGKGGFDLVYRDGSSPPTPLTGEAITQAQKIYDCVESHSRAECGQPVPPQSSASNPPPAPAPQTTSPVPAEQTPAKPLSAPETDDVSQDQSSPAQGLQTAGPETNTTGTSVASGPAPQTPVVPEVNIPSPVPSAPPQPKPQPVLPPTARLTAVPESITQGHSALLSWTTENATSVSIQPGVGPLQANGSVRVAPRTPTTYTLTASGAGLFAIARVTVNVLPAGPSQGTIVWEGDIHGTTPVSIEGNHASVGTIVSGGLPGLPCTVRLESSHRAILQTSPAQWNGWMLILLQVGGSGTVTVRISWSLMLKSETGATYACGAKAPVPETEAGFKWG